MELQNEKYQFTTKFKIPNPRHVDFFPVNSFPNRRIVKHKSSLKIEMCINLTDSIQIQ